MADENLQNEESQGIEGISLSENNTELNKQYAEFNAKFPIEKLKSLTLEEFTNLNKDNDDYFCTWVEQKLRSLGSIQGATSLKFGIYRYNKQPEVNCKKDDKYAWRSSLGNSATEAFENVRSKLVQVAEAASKDPIDFDAIDKCDLSPMFKWKVAFLYSKHRLLSVYSENSLYYLAQEKGMEISKNTKISDIQQFLLQKQDCDNRWDYTKSLWQEWDNRPKEPYNDFPVERWLSLFSENSVFSSENLDTLKKFLAFGGSATCAQLSQKYGKDAQYYNSSCINLAKRVANRLALVPEKRENGNLLYWPILFDGRDVNKNDNILGTFLWTLKPNLKTALEQYFNMPVFPSIQYFVAKISDAPNIFKAAVENNCWRMQERYKVQNSSAVTNNFNPILSMNPGDVLLLVNGDKIYAYGHAKNVAKNPQLHYLLKDVVSQNNHYYPSNDCNVTFDDNDVYYEKIYEGCKDDWSQYIDVDKWKSYRATSGVTIEGVMSATSFARNSIYKVSADWARKKIKELNEQFFKNLTESERMIQKTKELLMATKNLILHGAPGTGKTYLAKEIAESMGAEWKMVQFHQSYDYTDFVDGLRPKNDDGKVVFERRDGVFKIFCEKALKTKAVNSIDNFEESFDKLTDYLAENEFLDVPLLSGKGAFRIALNSNEDGFVTLIPKEDGKYEKDSTRFYNKAQCYNVYRELPGTPKKGFDNYRKTIVKEMKKSFGLKDYAAGNTENNDTSTKPFVFIIDEINRGEMSKIFGELFFSIDPGYRGKDGAILTQYANMQSKDDANEFDRALNATEYGHFFVPENVYIIGTMNDIDRSVESMDFAMRRRFAFMEIKAEDRVEMLKDAENGIPDIADEAETRMKNLNKAIEGVETLSSAYDIGPAYFLKLKNYFNGSNNEEAFAKLWEYHIEGVVKEYLRGMDNAGDLLKKLKAAYDIGKPVDPKETSKILNLEMTESNAHLFKR